MHIDPHDCAPETSILADGALDMIKAVIVAGQRDSESSIKVCNSIGDILLMLKKQSEALQFKK